MSSPGTSAAAAGRTTPDTDEEPAAGAPAPLPLRPAPEDGGPQWSTRVNEQINECRRLSSRVDASARRVVADCGDRLYSLDTLRRSIEAEEKVLRERRATAEAIVKKTSAHNISVQQLSHQQQQYLRGAQAASFSKRKSEAEKRISDLKRRNADLYSQLVTVMQRERDVDDRSRELDEQERKIDHALAVERQRLAQMRSELNSTDERERSIKGKEASVAERQRQLDEREARLAAAHDKLVRDVEQAEALERQNRPTIDTDDSDDD